MQRRRLLGPVFQWQQHEEPGMPAETLCDEGLRDNSSFVHEQLRFDAMDARRLLEGFDHMREQSRFSFGRIRHAPAISDKKIANYPFAALVNKKRVAEDLSAIDSCVTR